MEGVPDRELVARIRGGDETGFDELVRRYTPKIYGMLVRMTGNASLAEDAAQETLVRAWRGLERFRGDAQFSTWLYRIAVNEGNRLMARESKRETLPLEDATAEVPAIASDTAAIAENAELREQLRACLAELPDNYRLPVMLRDVEGFSNEEVAEILEINVRNMKSRLHRGRMALRKMLEDMSETS